MERMFSGRNSRSVSGIRLTNTCLPATSAKTAVPPMPDPSGTAASNVRRSA